jgi:WD40 repeat protein
VKHLVAVLLLTMTILATLITAPAAEAASYVTHLDPVTNPNIPKPRYIAKNPLRTSYTDPAFGTTVLRVTGDPGTRILLNGTTDTGRKWPKEVCHNSSYGDVAWNADSSLLFLTGCDRTQNLLLDGNTFKVLRVQFNNRVHGVNVWDRNNPERTFEIGGSTIYEYFPRTDTSKLLYTLTGYSGLSAQGQTRRMANDGKSIALRATKAGKGYNFCFDLTTGQKGPDIPVVPDQPRGALISPSGKYLIARYPGGRLGGYEAFECATGKKVFEYHGEQPEHGDTYIYQSNGREYIVGGGYRVSSLDLLNGELFAHTPKESFCEHASTRNYQDGEWAITSCGSSSKYFPREIIAVRIGVRQANVVRRLAHHNSFRGRNYEAEVHPNVSPDGKKIVFASNWRGLKGADDNAPVSTYVILLPDWTPQIATR